MSKARVRKIPMGKTKFVPQTFYPPETTTQGNVEVRFVSDERTEKEQDILVLRETITQLVELTEDFLRQLNELGYHPESQQAIIAYMTLTRAASHFKILQTEVQNFRG